MDSFSLNPDLDLVKIEDQITRDSLGRVADALRADNFGSLTVEDRETGAGWLDAICDEIVRRRLGAVAQYLAGEHPLNVPNTPTPPEGSTTILTTTPAPAPEASTAVLAPALTPTPAATSTSTVPVPEPLPPRRASHAVLSGRRFLLTQRMWDAERRKMDLKMDLKSDPIPPALSSGLQQLNITSTHDDNDDYHLTAQLESKKRKAANTAAAHNDRRGSKIRIEEWSADVRPGTPDSAVEDLQGCGMTESQEAEVFDMEV
ncbi:MAG: hypothetical protein L6R40_006821 [Gallowayella cf. fulva]|nr:MAG: hypothetical protein L6R40_006821 [Xanthomendoza cf. fulva]